MNNCEKSFLNSRTKHWQIAYVSNMPREQKNKRMESIEKAIYNSGYSDATCKKWMENLLKWKDKIDSKPLLSLEA